MGSNTAPAAAAAKEPVIDMTSHFFIMTSLREDLHQ
jgi:hypothetical protein